MSTDTYSGTRKPPSQEHLPFGPAKPERTGWRDASLSERHRLWGFDLPAVDLDFVLVEYDRGRAVALVEYKHERSPSQYPASPNIRALTDLADRAGVPLIGVRYAADFEWLKATPLNRFARNKLPQGRTTMTEMQWIEFLYALRGHTVPRALFDEPIAV